MIKTFTRKFEHLSSKRWVLATSLVLLLSQVSFSQSRVETFDEPVLITPKYDKDIFGNDSGTPDRITYDYIENIPQGTGRWFTGATNDTDLNFIWTESDGNPGGAITKNYGTQGAVTVFYIFNNTNSDVTTPFAFSADYQFGIDAGISDKLGAISFFSIPIQDPVSSMDWRTHNSGTGAFSDNGIVRFKGSNNTGRIFWNPDITGVGAGGAWATYSSADLDDPTELPAGWIVVGFAFGNSTTVDDIAGLVNIDNVVLPFNDTKVDDVAPEITLNSGTFVDSVGVFASEVGLMYLVPGGTEATDAAIKAANVLSETTLAVPITGTALRTDLLTDGKYDIYVIDEAGNISTGAQINKGTDVYAPLITSNPSGTSVFAGFDDITAVIDEEGTLKLVADGADASATAVVSVAALEKTLTTLEVPGTVAAGQYDLYAIDAAGNASATHIDITVETPDLIAPVITITGESELITSDTIFFDTDNDFTAIYVVPTGTVNNLDSVRFHALDSSLVGGTTGQILAVSLEEGSYELYSVDRFGNFGTSGGVLSILDQSGPIAFSVTSGQLDKGFPISVTLNEDGTVYVAPAGTALEDIIANAVISADAIGNTLLAISTDVEGIVKGQSYDIYAIDLRENWSEKLSTVAISPEIVVDPSVLSLEDDLQLTVSPNPAVNTINVSLLNSDVKQLQLLDLGGKKLLTSTQNYLNVGALNNGIYVLRISTTAGFAVKRVVINH